MIRVLVTEDEMPILRSTCTLVERMNPEFKVMYRAGNGQEALEILEQQEVELLLLDIQMPIMDGVQLLKIMKERKIDVPTIVLSGYQDFSYVREALRCGAIDYMLKPLKKEELQTTLAKVETIIWNKKSKRKKKTSVVASNQTQDNNYEIALVICGAYRSSIEDEGNQGIENRGMNYVETYMHENLPKDSWWMIPGQFHNECLVVVRKLGNRTKQTLDNLLLELENSKDSYPPFTIIMSKKEHSHDSIYQENQLLHALAKEVMFLDKGQVSQDEMEAVKEQNKIQHDSKRKVIMKAYHPEQIMPSVRRALDGVDRRCVMIDLLKSGFWKYSELFRGNYTYQELEEELVRILESAYTREMLFAALEKLVINDFYDNEQFQKVNKAAIALQMKEYLEENYMKVINNNTLSERYGYVSAHLRELFRKQYQVSPMEYLQGIRLQKSEELLMEQQNLSLKEISELIGFSDSLYFSKVFRKCYGMSPSEYRKRGLEDEI